MEKELSELDKSTLINECGKYFRDIADEDYIAARLLFRSGFHEQYIILGQQAIEKYLKSILLFNEIKLVKEEGKNKGGAKFGHELEELFDEVNKLPHISGIDFLNMFDIKRYFLHTFNGAENIKYRVNGSSSSPQSLGYLDQFVFYYRGFCRNNFIHFSDGKVKHRSEYKHYPYNDFGRLQDIIRKEKDTMKYENLVWKNPYWGRKKKRNIRITGKNSFKNPIFWGNKELEFISEYIFIPKGLKESFQKQFNKFNKSN